jgi:hypothetical protein
MIIVTTTWLHEIGVCDEALDRATGFIEFASESGDSIPLTEIVIRQYLKEYPDDWAGLAWLAWALIKARYIVTAEQDPHWNLIWGIAQIAFREQPDGNAMLRPWAAKLGDTTWGAACNAANDRYQTHDDIQLTTLAWYADMAAANAATAYARNLSNGAPGDAVKVVDAVHAIARLVGKEAEIISEIIELCIAALIGKETL